MIVELLMMSMRGGIQVPSGYHVGITFEPLGDFGKIGGDISIQNMRYGRFNEGNLELFLF